jgi:hypothetical protein
MEYAAEPPEEIAEYIKRAAERDRSTNVFLVARHIADQGFLLIGTADPAPNTVYTPKERQIFRDNLWRQDVLVDRDRPTLQATWSGKLAVQCALLGDINTPGQRMATDPTIFQQRYRYGWDCIDILAPAAEVENMLQNEDDILPHADERLLPIFKRNRNLSGRIDIIRPREDSFSLTTVTGEGEEIIRQGMLKTYESHAVVGSLPVIASDLYYIGMDWRSPAFYD